MSFQVLIKRKSVEAINELPGKTRGIIRDKIKSLEQDPSPGTGGTKSYYTMKKG